MATCRTLDSISQTATAQIPGAQALGRAAGFDGRYFRAPHRHSLGGSAPRNGLRFRHDMLASFTAVAAGGDMAKNPREVADTAQQRRQDRPVSGRCGQFLCPRCIRREKTGPNPTDRRKAGSKHHLITDAQGVPLATIVTAANRHDLTQLLPLVDAIPDIAGKVGRPRCKPDTLLGDRGYDSNPHRDQLRQRSIEPVIARRRTGHGSGLGVFRWVVERTISWLHQFRRLKIRYERRPEIHQAFLNLGCSLICWNFLRAQ
jgi:transposase